MNIEKKSYRSSKMKYIARDGREYFVSFGTNHCTHTYNYIRKF